MAGNGVGIGVVGYGYWGPNLVRNFNSAPGARVVAVCDQSPQRRAQVEALYPAVKTYADVESMLTDPKLDAVAIATPVSTHFKLSLAALKAGKHVFVEKPMTTTSAEAQQLIDEASQRKLTLM